MISIWLLMGSLACDLSTNREDSGLEIPVDSGETLPDSGAKDTDSGQAVVWDRDQDGYPEDEDCNDYEESVYPGAPEQWNAVDDDCDGRVDADGTYAGDVSTSGSVVVEGVATDFALSCPAELTRASAAYQLSIDCRPEDKDALEYLGEQLQLTASDSGLSGASWAGSAELSSSQGWSTQIVELSLTWIEFSQLELEAVMSSSTASLSLNFRGDLVVVQTP